MVVGDVSVSCAIPISLLMDYNALNSFENIQYQNLSLLVPASMPTIKNPWYISYSYKKHSNLTLKNQDSCIILNCGQKFDNVKLNGIGVIFKNFSSLFESIYSKKYGQKLV